MATVLIVSGSYFPFATANAVCAKKFEDVLKEKGHRVVYCNRKHDLCEPDFHVYEGTELYTVGKNSDLFYQTVDKLKNLKLPNKMSPCASMAFKFFRILMKTANLGKSHHQLRKNASEQFIEEYAEKIISIVETENVDLVISVSMPFDSHRATLRAMKELKGRNNAPKWIAYNIDAYWSKAGVQPGDALVMKKEEFEVLDASDMILLLDTIAGDYEESCYDPVRNKIKSLPLPLFDLSQGPICDNGIVKQKGELNLLFAGTIYDDYSNVEALDAILRRSNVENMTTHIMGKIYPKSSAILTKLSNDLAGHINIYGRMPYDFAKGSMQRADILINLANDNANQIPSKIFEYIASRKPILNIYRMKDDVGTKYLRKYPLAFNFDVNHIDNELARLDEWLKNIGKQSVTTAQLTDIYKEMLTPTITEKFYEMAVPYLS